MDIKPIPAQPSGDERQAIDALLGPPRSAWDGGARGSVRDAHVATVGGAASRAMRHLLLPALQALQARVGWISEGGLGYVCDRLNVPPADAWGVATFYALLATSPRQPRVVHICDDIACKCRGADQLIAELERQPPGVEWHRSPCLGMCDQSPAAYVTVAGEHPRELQLGHVTADQVRQDPTAALAVPPSREHFGRPPVRQPLPELRLLRRVGRVDPSSLDAYRASRGFEALAKARSMGADAVIAEIIDSKLMGRGGAAFPTGRKWDAVRKERARPHYLICNADESEPGTFKDRVLMEEDPFAIIEAMAVAAFATDCDHGYIYIRGEYPTAAGRLRHAIDSSRSAGLLGGFDIEIRRGGGAYICGEETAIFESIEGHRGEPRNKPPFPVQVGLFGKPTVVNNVETLANVPEIILDGAAAFAAIGTPQSTGTRLFCVSGSVQHPGLYEAPFGVTLRSVIDMAGGLPAGRTLRAVLLGGAAGTFVRPDELDLKLTHEDTRMAKTTLGSGVVMAFDDSVDLYDIVLRIASFFRDESCGQCVPCRVGTIRQEEALHRIGRGANGRLSAELAILDDVGAAMKDASICGLGQTAYSAIESAIKRLQIYDSGRTQ
jgi:NADH-quinone oxidoreductase subunit F